MISKQDIAKQINKNISFKLKISKKSFVEFKFKQLGKNFKCSYNEMMKLINKFETKSVSLSNIRNKYIQTKINKKIESSYNSLLQNFLEKFPEKHREQLDFMNVSIESLYKYSRNDEKEYEENLKEKFFSYRLYFTWISSNYENIDFNKLNLYIEKYYNSKEEFIEDFKKFGRLKKDSLSINDKKDFQRLTEIFEKGEFIPKKFN